MQKIYLEIENKLLALCHEKAETSFKRIINVSDVLEHADWQEIKKLSPKSLDFLLTSAIYKVFLLACFWHPSVENEEGFDFVVQGSEDISNYLDNDEVKTLFKLYKKTEYGGGFEGDAIDLINRLYKIMALCASIGVEFPIKPVVLWIHYLKNIIDEGDMYPIYGMAYGNFYPVECLAKTLVALNAYDLNECLDSESIADIYLIMDKVLSTGFNAKFEDSIVVNQVFEILGLGSKKYIHNNRKWTKILVDWVETQDNSADWKKLIMHLAKVSEKKPTRKWMDALANRVENIDDKRLDKFYTTIVEAIVEEIPIEYPFASIYNYNFICGLVNVVAHLKLINASQNTFKLAEYALLKIPNFGVSLPKLAHLCIASFKLFDDEYSYYALAKLNGGFQNNASKLPIRIIDTLEKTITHKRANKNLSLKQFHEIAAKFHSKLPTEKSDQSLDDKQILKELKRLGMDLKPIKKDHDADDNSGYLLENNRVKTLYLWRVKPPKSWELIRQFQQLEVLFLRFYNTKTIRNEIRQLPLLKHLDIEAQNLVSLSSKDFMMPSLEILNVSDNYIELFDENIQENHTLKALILDGNKLKGFPKTINQLKALERLSISSKKINPIQQLPETLVHLDLANCGLDEVNENITNLTNLESLLLLDNPISELPKTLLNLKNLKLLNIEATALNHVPDFLSEIKSIKQIFIDEEQAYNKRLWKLVERDYEEVLEDEYFIGEEFYLVPC